MSPAQLAIWIRNAYEAHDRLDLEDALRKMLGMFDERDKTAKTGAAPVGRGPRFGDGPEPEGRIE